MAAALTRSQTGILVAVLLAIGITAAILKPKGRPVPAPVGAPASVTGLEGAAEKILTGADRAFEKGFIKTALDFYRDFELRYAGSAAYDANVPRIWEQMMLCHEKLGNTDDTLYRFVDQRNKLQVRWLQLKAAPPGPERQAFLEALPPGDGRRAQLSSGDEKK